MFRATCVLHFNILYHGNSISMIKYRIMIWKFRSSRKLAHIIWQDDFQWFLKKWKDIKNTIFNFAFQIFKLWNLFFSDQVEIQTIMFTSSLYTTLYLQKVIYRHRIIDERYFMKNNLMTSIHRDQKNALSSSLILLKFWKKKKSFIYWILVTKVHNLNGVRLLDKIESYS